MSDLPVKSLWPVFVTTSLVALVGLAAACGPRGNPEPYNFDSEGACKTDPAIAATRASTPPDRSDCLDADGYNAVKDGCNETHDPTTCYQASICVLAQALALDEGDPRRPEYDASAMAGFEVACQGKIAEGCVNHAAMIEEQLKAQPDHPDAVALRATMCDGYRTACQLGVEWDGCGRCIASGCTGLDEPAPATP